MCVGGEEGDDAGEGKERIAAEWLARSIIPAGPEQTLDDRRTNACETKCR